MVIKIKEDRIISNLYCKPTDGHQYLHYESCNGDHIKRSIISSQTIRLKRLCSEKNDLNAQVEKNKKRFYSSIRLAESVDVLEKNIFCIFESKVLCSHVYTVLKITFLR